VWPSCGGANGNIITLIKLSIRLKILIILSLLFSGSIRFKKEYDIKYNNGIEKAITILERIKAKYSAISWADLIQMSGAVAVELSGGPNIDMIYGRVDCPSPNSYDVKVLICYLYIYIYY
jgi:hypothetical protein